MALRQEAFDVFIVHRGAHIHDMYLSPDAAFDALRKLIQQSHPFVMTQGLIEYGRVCNKYGLEGRSQLPLVEARKEFEKLEIIMEARRKGLG